MKKGILLFSLLFLAQSFVYGQVWFEVGAKGMYGLNGLYNKNLYDDSGTTLKLNSVLAYGGELSINFADKHGINIEALLSNNKQTFDHVNDLGAEFKNELAWKNLDAYILYRSYSAGGVYFELGPKISFVNGVDHKVNGVVQENWEEYYVKKYYSGSLGFGGFIAGNEFFSLKMGIRIDYAFGDFVNEDGEALGYPTYYKTYETYKKSNPWSATVSLGVNFGIGGVAKAQCGQRVFMIGNGY